MKQAGMGRNGPENSAGGLAGGLKPTQEEAAVALAAGATLEEAARTSGAGMTTIKTWLAAQPAFRRRVTELRAALTERALGRLADAMTSAVNTLLHLSARGKTETTRLRASEALLTHGVRVRESVELADRVAALEEGRP